MRRRPQRGAQSLEFVALLPLVILTLLLMLQTALFGYTLVVAETATREAALTATYEQKTIRDWPADNTILWAAREVAGGLPIEVTEVRCARDRVTVTAETQMPNLLFEQPMRIKRTVTMPLSYTEGCP
jgi:Flp pilus assembly protein TadG